MSIGERDRLLLDLREAIFGPGFAARTACPACGEELELAFLAGDVRIEAAPPADGRLSLIRDGYTVEFRLPTAGDLLAVFDAQDPEASLLHRCVVRSCLAGEPVAVSHLPPGIVDAVGEEMREADPQADITLVLTCCSCTYEWQAAFDIVSYLWAEVASLARRTLHEVHILASAYGWSETEILAMSAWRRERYLELVD